MKIKSLFGCYFGRWYLCQCGHKAKWKTAVTVGEGTGVFSLDANKEFCPDCWLKAGIKCAWCQSPILPGEPITLYTPVAKDFQVPPYAVVYQESPLQLVGCLGWGCAETGADRAGFWVFPGRVERVISPLELLMKQVAEGNCSPVMIGDLSNRQEAARLVSR